MQYENNFVLTFSVHEQLFFVFDFKFVGTLFSIIMYIFVGPTLCPFTKYSNFFFDKIKLILYSKDGNSTTHLTLFQKDNLHFKSLLTIAQQNQRGFYTKVCKIYFIKYLPINNVASNKSKVKDLKTDFIFANTDNHVAEQILQKVKSSFYLTLSVTEGQ